MNVIQKNTFANPNEEIFRQFSQSLGNKTLTLNEKITYYLNILHKIVDRKDSSIQYETKKNIITDDEEETEEILSLFEKELNIKNSLKENNENTLKKNEKQNGKRLSKIFQQIDNKIKSLVDQREMTNDTNKKIEEENFDNYFNNNKHAEKIIEVVRKHKRQSLHDVPSNKFIKMIIKKNNHKDSKKNKKNMKSPIIKKFYKTDDSYGSPSRKKIHNYENVNADKITNFAKLPGVNENCPFDGVDETAEFNKFLEQMSENGIEFIVFDEKNVGKIRSTLYD